MATTTKRARGLVAVARASRGGGDDGAPARKKYCSNLCKKPAGTCCGCRSSFGWVSPETALYMENYIGWHVGVETERRAPPYEPGQTVVLNGTECTFVRYRSRKSSSMWCAVKEKNGGCVHAAVKERQLSVPARTCPPPPPGALAHLHFGAREFRFLRRKFSKWVYAQLHQTSGGDDFDSDDDEE
jgi:hypothetical protein